MSLTKTVIYISLAIITLVSGKVFRPCFPFCDLGTQQQKPASVPAWMFTVGMFGPMTHESSMKSSSLPRLDNSDYQERGEVVDLGGLDIYVVGNGRKCIIWNYDIYGFDSGRSRQLCDEFAAEGFTVIMPDYYRGTSYGTAGWTTAEDKAVWSNLRQDWEGKIHPYAVESKGAESFGTIGTCWGSYMTIRLSSYPMVVAGVSMHPAHSEIMAKLGEDEEEIMRRVGNKQLMMPSMNDSSHVKPGGLAERILGDRVEILKFPEMMHGWTTRGRLEDEKVNRDVRKAVNKAIQFFKTNL